MTPREEYLTQYFNEWLDRFSPPRAIQNNPKAMQDDADAMLRTVLRAAPSTDYAEWLDKMLLVLSESMTTRSWPAPGELAKACKSQMKATGKPTEKYEIDTYANAAKKMKAGEAVGEGFLYGREACEMIKRQLIDQETMTAYRSAAFFARKDASGEEAALRWEAEAKERHEVARELLRDRERKQFNTTIPNKRSVPSAA